MELEHDCDELEQLEEVGCSRLEVGQVVEQLEEPKQDHVLELVAEQGSRFWGDEMTIPVARDPLMSLEMSAVLW